MSRRQWGCGTLRTFAACTGASCPPRSRTSWPPASSANQQSAQQVMFTCILFFFDLQCKLDNNIFWINYINHITTPLPTILLYIFFSAFTSLFIFNAEIPEILYKFILSWMWRRELDEARRQVRPVVLCWRIRLRDPLSGRQRDVEQIYLPASLEASIPDIDRIWLFGQIYKPFLPALPKKYLNWSSNFSKWQKIHWCIATAFVFFCAVFILFLWKKIISTF